jgi:hypothetical protein
MQVEQIDHSFLAHERIVSAQMLEKQGKKRKKQTSFDIEYCVSIFLEMPPIFSKD